MACHILLEISRQKIFLRPYLNHRSAQEIMSLQSCESFNFKNFGTPNLGVPRQNDIWVQAMWLGTKNTIRGKVVASLKFGHGESYEFVFARGSSVH
jgi:hypothetical protein